MFLWGTGRKYQNFWLCLCFEGRGKGKKRKKKRKKRKRRKEGEEEEEKLSFTGPVELQTKVDYREASSTSETNRVTHAPSPVHVR